MDPLQIHKTSVARLLTVALAAVSAAILGAGPASAATNDSFSVMTTDSTCGSAGGEANFVDHGAGAPGGGDNDDYIVIHDYCTDGHGVRAWLTWLGTDGFNWSGSKYNPNGLAGDPVYWDPFKPYGNAIAGDKITITVCLVDGSSDLVGHACAIKTHTMADG